MSTPEYILGERNSTCPLDNYYLFKQQLSEPEIQAVHDLVAPEDSEQGTAGGVIDPKYRSSNINWISNVHGKTDWLYERVAGLFQSANFNMWNADIQTIFDSIQYGRYDSEKEGHYGYHLDLGENVPRRKLSMSILLDDPAEYEGGGFFIKRGMTPILVPLKKGDVVVFPSFLLHKVEPVTQGVRRSLVSWASGPTWR